MNPHSSTLPLKLLSNQTPPPHVLVSQPSFQTQSKMSLAILRNFSAPVTSYSLETISDDEDDNEDDEDKDDDKNDDKDNDKDDDGDEVRVLLPGVGQPVPGHVIKAGLGAVCQQQLTQVPVTLHHNTFVPEMKQLLVFSKEN